MKPTAPEILEAAAGHLRERAATYDKPEGERSMAATVAAFNTITNHNLTTEQGWLLMACLKMVRAQSGNYRADSYEDGAAYFALAGESAAVDRLLPAYKRDDAYTIKMQTGPRYNNAYTPTAFTRTEGLDKATDLYEREMDRLFDKHLAAKKIGAKDKYHIQKGDYVAIGEIAVEVYAALHTVLYKAANDTFSENSGRFGWKYIGIDMSGGLRHWNIASAYAPNATERTPEYILGATPKEEI